MAFALHDGRMHLQCLRCARAFPVTEGVFTKHRPLRAPVCFACCDLGAGRIAPEQYAARVRRENYPTESALVWQTTDRL